MSKIPTAEKFLHQSNSLHDMWDNTRGKGEWDEKAIVKSHIEFAKLHVEECKKEYLQKGFGRYMNHAFDKNPTRVPIDEDSILNAYPLENIK